MYIAAIDQGTTGTTVLVFDHSFAQVGRAYCEIPIVFPKPGWVEQDAQLIYAKSFDVLRAALRSANISFKDLTAIGITNQRETTVVWDAATGNPVAPAISWQCGRTTEACEAYAPHANEIRQRTGLLLNPYFSATKLRHILDTTTVSQHLRFGTVDSWLLYKLSGGRVHRTDHTNASRTLLYNIHSRTWDEELLRLFRIPSYMLPEIAPSASIFGHTDPRITDGVSIPITGIAGDQQSALFGQQCIRPGDIKNTYGTGCFMLMYVGDIPLIPTGPLLATVCCNSKGAPAYALEGAVFTGGSVVQWLRDGLGIIRNAQETNTLAMAIPDNGGVYFVPAFTGLGAPYWNPHARALISGLTRGSRREHIVRAALEGIAFQCQELAENFVQSGAPTIRRMAADGGAAANDFLMQFQADILEKEVFRPAQLETTALGAAILAALGAGVFSVPPAIESLHTGRVFTPTMGRTTQQTLISQWRRAIERTLLLEKAQ